MGMVAVTCVPEPGWLFTWNVPPSDEVHLGDVEPSLQMQASRLAEEVRRAAPRLAVPLAGRGETLAIVGNDDPELVRPIGCEGNRCLPCRGVLAHVGQGFLDEPEELERCER